MKKNKQLLLGLIIFVIIFLLSSFCFFINLKDVPFGILLGGSFNLIMFYLINKFGNKKNLTLTIILTAVRFILLIVILFVCGYLYYKLNIKLFNIFGVAGGYLALSIFQIIYMSKEGKDGIK